MMDLIIRNARLRRATDLVDIAIVSRKISEIKAGIKGKGKQEIDAKGMLVTESFVNPHLHLCKVYTLEMMTEEALKA